MQRVSNVRFSALMMITGDPGEPARDCLARSARKPVNDTFLKTTPDDWQINFKMNWTQAITRAELAIPSSLQIEPKPLPSRLVIKRGWVEELEAFGDRVFEQVRTIYHNMQQPPQCERLDSPTASPATTPRRRRSWAWFDID